MTLRRLARTLVLATAAIGLGGCSFLGLGGKTVYKPYTVSVFHLSVGECLNPPTTVVASVATLSAISCHAPHTQQVFALVPDNAGDNYPGSSALVKFANAKCLQAFAAFDGIPYQQSSLFYTYLLPSVRSWSSGDRTVTCIITTTGQKLTSSMKGAKR